MQNRFTPYDTGVFVIAFLLFAYVVVRAANLSITHDEAFTFTRYVHHTYGEIVSYQTGNILPNNHILNTVSQKFFSGIFGPDEFALRIGTIIGCILFLVTSYFIARQFDGINMIAAFVILTMHPYLLDFMMLSRGYGIAVAFMLLSLYFFMRSVQLNFNLRFCIYGLLSAIVAVWANFSLLNYFFVVCAIYLIMQLSFKKPDGASKMGLIKTIAILVIFTLILKETIYEPVMIILDRQQLFGGEQGFWQDTVQSLTNRLAYGAGYENIWMKFIQIFILAVIAAAAAQVIYLFKTRKPDTVDLNLILFFSVTLGLAFASIAQFHFMGSFYPKDRLALSFIPPFILLFLFLIKSLMANGPNMNNLMQWAPKIFALILFIHMLSAINFTYVLDWKYDANTKVIAHEIESGDAPVLLGAHPLFEPALNFYKQTKNFTKYQQIHQDGYRKQEDYNYFVIPEEDEGKVARELLEVIKQYHPSSTILARVKAKEKAEDEE